MEQEPLDEEPKRERTDEELKQLAMDVADNKVFSSSHLRPGDENLIPMVFMPLSLMDEENINKIRDVTLIYEYYEKAGPRSINGYPTFFSFSALRKPDHEKLNKLHKAYVEMKQAFAEA